MATGRRDYTWGFAIETSITQRNFEGFFEHDNENIEGSDSAVMINYEVPVGYNVLLTHFYITSASPQLNHFTLYKNGAGIIYEYFTQAFHIDFDARGGLKLEPGDELTAEVDNIDDVAAVFCVTVIGLKEPII